MLLQSFIEHSAEALASQLRIRLAAEISSTGKLKTYVYLLGSQRLQKRLTRWTPVMIVKSPTPTLLKVFPQPLHENRRQVKSSFRLAFQSHEMDLKVDLT